MITIETEFDGKTAMGYGHSTFRKDYFERYRDIETVEEVIKLVSKLFNNKNLSNQMATFEFFSHDKSVTVCRFSRFYSDTIEFMWWEKNEYYANKVEIGTKLSKKEIRKAYLDTVEKLRHFEWEKEQEVSA